MDDKDSSTPPALSRKSRANKANRKTMAAKYNLKVLRGLESMLLDDPEADLTTALSSLIRRSCSPSNE